MASVESVASVASVASVGLGAAAPAARDARLKLSLKTQSALGFSRVSVMLIAPRSNGTNSPLQTTAFNDQAPELSLGGDCSTIT